MLVCFCKPRDTNEAKPEKESADPKNGSKPMDADTAKTKRNFFVGRESEFRRDHMEVSTFNRR